MGNFDGCTKKGLGDPGVEIRTTIRPGKGGGGGGVGQRAGWRGGFTTSGEFVCFSPLSPSLPPTIFYAGWRKKRGAVKLERVPDI